MLNNTFFKKYKIKMEYSFIYENDTDKVKNSFKNYYSTKNK